MTTVDRQGLSIDPTQVIEFSFDGKLYSGCAGDTIASALLASGVRVFGRSFKYHRLRGVLRAGRAEPNALVRVEQGGEWVGNIPATTTLLYPKMKIKSQNRWPHLLVDFLAINQLFTPLLSAGFYYKTFMWPRRFWTALYEPIIRRAAGLGPLPTVDFNENGRTKHHESCELLVIGGGLAGLSAALEACRLGHQVILCESQALAGGRSLFDQDTLPLVQAAMAELKNLGCTVYLQTGVFGVYDHNHFAAIDNRSRAPCLRKIDADKVIYATGALERPMLFLGNDRPGVILGSTVRELYRCYGTAPYRRAIVVGNYPDTLMTAECLAEAQVDVVAVVDPTPTSGGNWQHLSNYELVDTAGWPVLKKVRLRSPSGEVVSLNCDLLCICGGWDPAVELLAQRGIDIRWHDSLDRLIAPFAQQSQQSFRAIGSVRGVGDQAACLQDAQLAVHELLGHFPAVENRLDDSSTPNTEIRYAGADGGEGFIDFQHDVKTTDLDQAIIEGYQSFEHLKRYTTLGMATDQGRSGNTLALKRIAAKCGIDIALLAKPRARAPSQAVEIASLAGYHIGKRWRPSRRTPLHQWQADRGARFVESGDWQRAKYFPQGNETLSQAVEREVLAVRRCIGLCDVSTLAKFELQGPDALNFIEAVFANNFASLTVGRSRYAIVLREDGVLFDDGTISRLDEERYFLTTTTSNASAMQKHLSYCQQVLFPQFAVSITDVTDDWAAVAIAGPEARTVLQAWRPELDFSSEHIAYLDAAKLTLGDTEQALLIRLSFSGELAYELYLQPHTAVEHLNQLTENSPVNITHYGEESLDVLRIEKGHIASELNGRSTPIDLGMQRMLSKRKPFVGKALLNRPSLQGQQRLQLVGLVAEAKQTIPIGGLLLASPDVMGIEHEQGYVTSAAVSPILQQSIALALLTNGRHRHGESIFVVDKLHGIEHSLRIVAPMFYDPDGERLYV